MTQMKRIFIFGALALLLAGCSSKLDEIRPKDKISSSAVNEADLGKLTNGILNRMESLTVSFWCDGDYLGENFTSGPGFDFADFHGEIASSSSSWAKSRWQTGFVAIMHINELLKSANLDASFPLEKPKFLIKSKVTVLSKIETLKTPVFCIIFVV